jgi:hypothetical protein
MENFRMGTRTRSYALWIAIALVFLYVGAGGAAKLAGVPYVHSSFPKLGLPPWFGYLIGVCEVLGCIAFYIFWTSRADLLALRTR